MVLRVTSGMLTALASLAPEPTVFVAPAPPLDPVAASVASPGMLVLLPGCMLDIPLNPVTEKDMGIAVPPGGRRGKE